MDVGNLISGSSAFSKSSLNFWKFSIHILLKPQLENFEHYFASVQDECSCMVVWTFFGIAFFGIGMKADLLQSHGPCWVFKICWHIECNTFTESSLRTWNSSTGIPSLPVALFMGCFLRFTLLCTPGCLAIGEWSHHHDYLAHKDLFCIVLLCILSTSS